MSPPSKINAAEEFCTGCGLCAMQGKKLSLNENGFYKPDLTVEDADFCQKFCPVFSGKHIDTSGPWGKVVASYLGWSSEEKIRFQASSGGTLTMLALYLLESEKVDGIIQTCADDRIPYRAKTVCSTTRQEILNCAGSRYAQSSPLAKIAELTEAGKRYAFIGKPCDVYALRRFTESELEYKLRFPYMLSFLCAGAVHVVIVGL